MLVSVCIPTFNQWVFFKRCIDSVVSQTFRDFEIIITDDSRTGIIKEFIDTYDFKSIPIVYLQNEIQLGAPANWNKAISLARGKYIKVLHHDDWFTYSNSLEVLVLLMENNPLAGLGFVATKNILLSSGEYVNTNKPTCQEIQKIEVLPISLLDGNKIGAPSATIFRRNDLNYIFFDEKLVWHVDSEAYINLLLKHKSSIAYDELDAISSGISDFQITRKCEFDVSINVFEFFYCLKKHNALGIKNKVVYYMLIHLLDRFNLDFMSEIKNYFPEGVTNKIRFILLIRRSLKLINSTLFLYNRMFIRIFTFF